ncbi:MAG: hypothetical protein RIC87_20975 [Kiloniellales bacterium]
MLDSSPSGNPFGDEERLMLRLDMASRSEDMQALIKAAPDFDLVIVDEAHRLSASYSGGEVKYTKRFLPGRMLAGQTRHLLLMTATPHNGKDEDFQLFLSLLDGDRFEGAHRDGLRAVKTGDLMRRLVKEELYWFDSRKLFPKRLAYTVSYEISPAKADLYAAVTGYVRQEMNQAEILLIWALESPDQVDFSTDPTLLFPLKQQITTVDHTAFPRLTASPD